MASRSCVSLRMGAQSWHKLNRHWINKIFSASMCKHVAAVLYGIGTRLDTDPMLFFELRGIDSRELLKQSMEKKLDRMLANAGKKSDRHIEEADVSGIFGI